MPDESARPLLVTKYVFPAALLIAFLIGGGGAEGPLRNGLIAAAGSFFLIWIGLDQFGRHPLPKGARLPAVVAASLLLIPLLQLVPLPPGVWQSLPGREYAIEALRVIGAADTWRPLSIDPEATARAAAFLLWPLAVFLYTLRASRSERLFGLALFVAAAAVSGVIGALQLAAGHPAWLSFYDGPNIGMASGVFANPNHQALMMVSSIVACGILIRCVPSHAPHSARRPGGLHLALWAAMFFFAVMALASGARAGVLLLALGLPGGMLIALGAGSVLRWVAAISFAAAALAIFILLYPASNSLGVRESFSIGADIRFAYLPDIIYTLQQYWPAGSGTGTFANVFAPNENLDFAQRGLLHHAHNDFIEWLIDMGALGAVWLFVAAITILSSTYRLFRDRSHDVGLAAGGLFIALLAAAHSLADFPLRTLSLASLSALALGVFLGHEENPSVVRRRSHGLLPLMIGLLVALPISAETLRLFTVQWALRENRHQVALSLGPSNSRALVRRGEEALQAHQAGVAEQVAAAAIIAHPMDAAALRLLAMAREAQGQPASTEWRVASSLGWRDAATQFWAFRQALVDNEQEVAAVRADALLRTSRPPQEFVRLVRGAAVNEAFAHAIARRLRVNSPWRVRFFTMPADPSPGEVQGLLAVLRVLSASPGELQPADGRSIISYLINRKSYEQAIEVDRLVVGARVVGGNFLDDGSFDRQADEYRSDVSAFDWVLRKGDHGSASVDPVPPSRLNVDSDGNRSVVAADRYIELPPGHYRLSYLVKSDQPDAFRVNLICAARSQPLAVDLTPETSRFVARERDFEVVAGCPLVRLLIESVSSGVPATAAYDDFRIVRHKST